MKCSIPPECGGTWFKLPCRSWVEGMLLVVLANLALALSQSLHEWVVSPQYEPLSSSHLWSYIPQTVDKVPPYALSRFSISQAVERWYNGREIVPPQQRQAPDEFNTLTHEDLQYLSDNNQFKLGLVYFWSLGGVQRDFEQAVQCFERAAQLGDADAMYMLGVSYSSGLLGAIDEDQGKAQLYYTLAADAGCLEAQIALGNRLRYGINTPIDMESALYYLRSAGMVLLDDLEAYLGEQNDPTYYDGTIQPPYYNEGDIPSQQKKPYSELWHYARVLQLIYSFGGEEHTGLYGKNVYRQHLPPASSATLWMGDTTTATGFLNMLYPDEFSNLDEAIKTLSYHAEFDEDAKAMYALALIYYARLDDDASMRWVKKCIDQAANSQNVLDGSRIQLVHAMCLEFRGERLAHTREQTLRNFRMAYAHYMHSKKFFEKMNTMSANGYKMVCKTCSSGMALIEWRAALEALRIVDTGEATMAEVFSKLEESPSLLDKPVKKLLMEDEGGKYHLDRGHLIERFQNAFNTTYFITDYTLGMKLAQLYIEDGKFEQAVYVLRRVVSDAGPLAPGASLLLATLLPNTPDVINRFSEGIYALVDLFAPARFGMRAYEEGDLESAMLALMVSSELGVRSSTINLADLLDTQHSLMGKIIGPKRKLGRVLSEWPVPQFVGQLANRTALALKYFLRSTYQNSVDGLYKAIELDPSLEAEFLPILQRRDLGMAHFKVGLREFSAQNYERAMAMFSRAMISPEAWVPVKFWQFFTALKLLPLHPSENSELAVQGSGFLGWRKLYRAYRAIVAVDGYNAGAYSDYKGTKYSRHYQGQPSRDSPVVSYPNPPPHSPPAPQSSTFGRVIRYICLALVLGVTVHVTLTIMFPRGMPDFIVNRFNRVREWARDIIERRPRPVVQFAEQAQNRADEARLNQHLFEVD